MKPSRSEYVFTAEKPLRVDFERIIYISCTSNIDHREKYTSEKTDINVIAIMRQDNLNWRFDETF